MADFSVVYKSNEKVDCPSLPLSERQHQRAYPVFADKLQSGFMSAARSSVKEMEILQREMDYMRVSLETMRQGSLDSGLISHQEFVADEQKIKPGFEEEEECAIEFLPEPTAENKEWLDNMVTEMGRARSIRLHVASCMCDERAFWPLPADAVQRMLHYCVDDEKLDLLQWIQRRCPTRKFLRLDKAEFTTMCLSFSDPCLYSKAIVRLAGQVTGWYPIENMTAWDVVDCLAMTSNVSAAKSILTVLVDPAEGIHPTILNQVNFTPRGTKYALDDAMHAHPDIKTMLTPLWLAVRKMRGQSVEASFSSSSPGRVIRGKSARHDRRKTTEPFVPRSQVSDLAQQLEALMPSHNLAKEKDASDALVAELDKLAPGLQRTQFEGEALCTNCGLRPIQLIYFPCGDMLYCHDCHENLATNQCPCCKRTIERVLQPNVVTKSVEAIKRLTGI